jgi:hypothetical protein
MLIRELGNIIKGWEGFLNKQSKTAGITTQKKYRFSGSERIFSDSSKTAPLNSSEEIITIHNAHPEYLQLKMIGQKKKTGNMISKGSKGYVTSKNSKKNLYKRKTKKERKTNKLNNSSYENPDQFSEKLNVIFDQDKQTLAVPSNPDLSSSKFDSDNSK